MLNIEVLSCIHSILNILYSRRELIWIIEIQIREKMSIKPSMEIFGMLL